MNWLFVLFDTVFSALYSENWFDVISGKLTSRTENIVYQIEAGTFDFHALSRLLEHIVYLIPIVFALCLVVDFFIRSRFVRYSYKDEYQAKKSVWWNWQSQQDAYQALEAGSGQMALADHSEVDPNFRIVGAETWTPQPPVTQQPAAAPESVSEQEEEEEEDNIDRGMIEDARQNEIRKNARIPERVQNRFTDVRDGFTVFGSWFAFFPQALKRRVAMNRKNRELRKMYAAMNKKTSRPRRAVFEERDEEAAAEAYFAQDMMQNVVDGEFEQVETVETGGLDAFTFTHAAQTVQSVLTKPEEEEKLPEEEQEAEEDDVPEEEEYEEDDSEEPDEEESEEEEEESGVEESPQEESESEEEEPEEAAEEAGVEEESAGEPAGEADEEEEDSAQEESGEKEAEQEEPETAESGEEPAQEELLQEAEPETEGAEEVSDAQGEGLAAEAESAFEAAAEIVRETLSESE